MTNTSTSKLTDRYIAHAQSLGSNATTLRGASRFIKSCNHPFGAVRPELSRYRRDLLAKERRQTLEQWRKQEQEKRFFKVPLHSDSLARAADAVARSDRPRIRNWRDALPEIDVAYTGDIQAIEVPSGKWVNHVYHPLYSSFLRVAQAGKHAEYHAEGQLVRVVRPPAGLVWGVDEDGAYLQRCSDGTKYHPTCEDILARNFCARIRAAISTAKKQRREAVRLALRDHRLAANCRVTLHDARRAGNCTTGITAYLSRTLGLRRSEIVRAHASVPASLLGDNPAAQRAIACAIQRETMVSI